MIKIKIETERSEDATKVAALLEALGYEVERVGAGDEGAAWRLAEVVRKGHLTETETRVLEMLVRDETQASMAKALNVSRHEVRWQVSKVFAKTKRSREQLLDFIINGRATAFAQAR
jgi:DNA-binding CsgD family transcriptional regulator